MHEETRRLLLRVAFILLCLVPTIVVLGWAAFWALSLPKYRIEADLQKRLGVRVKIGHISPLRPGRLRVSGVQLFDLESGGQLAQLSQVVASKTAQGWQLSAPNTVIPLNGLAMLCRRAHQRLLADDALASQVAHLHIDRILIGSPTTPLELFDVDWARARQPDVQRSRMFFALEKNSAEDALRIDIQRDRSAAVPVTRVELNTGTSSLPVAVVAAAMGGHWSTRAQLRGCLPLTFVDGQCQGQFIGQLTQVELGNLPADLIPYELAGQATLNIDKSTFDQQGLRSIEGWLKISNLITSRELIRSLIGLRLFSEGPAYASVTSPDTFAATQFSIKFSLSEMGLVCEGIPDPIGLNVAAIGQTGILLLCEGLVPVDDLICALVPSATRNVYQARGRLMRTLPATLPGIRYRRRF